ncbi:MAG: DNA alkylation repair protein [Bacteroidaceae bacterium]
MDCKIVENRLFALADAKYKEFHSRLVPGSRPIIGVRLPQLRVLAKEILQQSDWRTYLQQAEDTYVEQTMLQSLILSKAPCKDFEEYLKWIAAFVSKIDNWAICDTFCAGLKTMRKHPTRVWEFLQPYLYSDKEYELRFGVVMLLDYYITADYLPLIYAHFNRIRHEGYYVKMAVAWTISACFVKFPDSTLHYLQNEAKLDPETRQKTLQKIVESLRVTPEMKAIVKNMRGREKE